MIVHDVLGTMFKSEAEKAKLHRCLFYNIGYIGSDKPHGHGMYIKNAIESKSISNCISINAFRHAIQLYSEAGDHADFVDMIGNVAINAGGPANLGGFKDFIAGAETNGVRLTGVKLINNLLYNCRGNIGYALGVIGMIRNDNYMPDGCIECGDVSYLENNNNTLISESGIVQFCTVDDYDATKGNLTIYNWDLDNTVTADLTALTGINVGNTVRLRSAEDYFNCYQDLVVAVGKTVTVNMQAAGKTVVTAIGHDFTPATNFPEFGCFLIEKI